MTRLVTFIALTGPAFASAATAAGSGVDASNAEVMRLATDMLHFIVTVLLTVYIFVSERRRVTRAALDERLGTITQTLEKTRFEAHERFDVQADRLSRAEAAIGHLTKQQDDHALIFTRVNTLSEALQAARATIEALETTINQLHRQIEVLNQYLLERGRG